MQLPQLFTYQFDTTIAMQYSLSKGQLSSIYPALLPHENSDFKQFRQEAALSQNKYKILELCSQVLAL